MINTKVKITGMIIVAGTAALLSCGGAGKKAEPGSAGPSGESGAAKNIDISDTLPDAQQFSLMVDDKTYSVGSADISVHFSETDSTLSIVAGKDDTARLNIVVADAKHVPGYRGNAWRSNNTKLAGSDSLVWQPTVELYKKADVLVSWNNLSDGQHESKPADDQSVYIYSLRQTGNHIFRIKGRISTRLLKNVYAASAKDWNTDHTVNAAFVIDFEDYWLKL